LNVALLFVQFLIGEVRKMSEVQRVCMQCGAGNPVEARYCAHCGYDTQAALPAPRASLPVVIGRAALPVLVGAASLAVRAGWKLLQNRLAQAPIKAAVNVPPAQPRHVPQNPPAPVPRTDIVMPRRARRTIHIRSSWAVTTGNGVWQQGHSESIQLRLTTNQAALR
jgi:ribosomal protein L40E